MMKRAEIQARKSKEIQSKPARSFVPFNERCVRRPSAYPCRKDRQPIRRLSPLPPRVAFLQVSQTARGIEIAVNQLPRKRLNDKNADVSAI